MSDLLRFIIPGKPEYQSALRLAVAAVADTAGFGVDEIEDIKTALTDACKMVFCHGRAGYVKEYEVSCLIEDDRLEINIFNTSSELCEKEEHYRCMDCPNEIELAIFVARSLMDDAKISTDENGCKKFTMIKRRK